LKANEVPFLGFSGKIVGGIQTVHLLQSFFGNDPKKLLIAGQFVIFGMLLFLLWRFLNGGSRGGVGSLSDDSSFGFRESDRKGGFKKNSPSQGAHQKLADAKLKAQPKGPALLTGINIQAAPHEILGVHPLASEETIQKAYRERMKQYHPDKVARPGTDQWLEAQQIADAIIRARAEMLKKGSK